MGHLQTSSSAIAERPRELYRRVGQFEAKFHVEALHFAPLRHYAIYAYLLNHLNAYFSDGMCGHIKI